MLAALTPRKLLMSGVVLLGVLGFSGCNMLGGLPANAHLGNTGVAYVTLSTRGGQVDTTLHTSVGGYIVQVGTNCGWNNVTCINSTAHQFYSGQQLDAVDDCGLQSGIGTICPFGDLQRAALEFAFAGLGPNSNCLGTYFTDDGNWVVPTNPPVGGVNSTQQWFTVWAFNPYGYGGDGNGVCVQ